MKKIITVIMIFMISFFIIGCTRTNANNTVGTGNIGNTASVENSTVDSTNQGTGTTSTQQTKEFNITAKQYEFIPGTITVNKGDIVILHVKSIDVTHGFAIKEYNINKQLPPNQEVTIEFTADKTGEFTIFCNIPCGPGHPDMKGVLIVN
jgi:cytochrome c oxidase subunit II